MSTHIMRTDDGDDCDTAAEAETDTDARKSRVPDQAILEFAWALAEASDRDEWTTDLEPLSAVSLRFDELREYTNTVEWVGNEVYVHAHKPRGEDPHPRRDLDVDLWLTFSPVPETQVRVTVMQ